MFNVFFINGYKGERNKFIDIFLTFDLFKYTTHIVILRVWSTSYKSIFHYIFDKVHVPTHQKQ